MEGTKYYTAPYRYEIRNGITYYIYKYSILKKWLTTGRDKGTSGMLVFQRHGQRFIGKSFGTIEHPNKNIQTINYPPWDPIDELTIDDKMIRQIPILITGAIDLIQLRPMKK